MKAIVVVLAALIAMAIGAFVASRSQASDPMRADAGVAELRSAIDALRAEVTNLQQRVDGVVTVDRPLPNVVDPARSSVHSTDVHVVAPERDARWYLEHYVASFADDVQGSEYFRLAVDAHAVELASPIAGLVRDDARMVALRIALVNMLGKRRFDESPEVLDALLAAMRPPSPEELAIRAVEALRRIGSSRVVPALEGLFPMLREPAVRERCLELLVDLGGDAVNPVLARLFATASDDAVRRLLIRALNGADSAAALDLLRAASLCEPPVRLDAAHEVGEHDDETFDTFVAEWRRRETDAQVLAVLGGADGARAVAGWSARKAVGPPNADSKRDDPEAWASRGGDMGLQWLQLGYARPMRANGVRIFEVNVPGAVAEIRALQPGGSWVTLWHGTASGNGSPLWIGFPSTTFDVSVIRVVLDTNRTPGWNEIDAVELVGPGGAQWAARATASSTYASMNVATDERRARESLLERGFGRPR